MDGRVRRRVGRNVAGELTQAVEMLQMLKRGRGGHPEIDQAGDLVDADGRATRRPGPGSSRASRTAAVAK